MPIIPSHLPPATVVKFKDPDKVKVYMIKEVNNSILAAIGEQDENSITISDESYGDGCTQLSRPSQKSLWDD